MKKLVTSYTFDASAQTIDSADFTSLEKIQLITNVTDQIIIYNFADTTKGGSLTSTTLTLEYDTTSMDDTDKLQIFVEDGAAIQPVSGTVAVTQSGTWDEVGINDSGNSITVDGAVTVTNGTAANLNCTEASAASIKTAVELIDNAVSGAGFNITQMNGVNVTMGNGNSGTGVQRVTIAADSTGQVKLAAGTAGIGKLTANSGVDIGDVDVTSIAAGDNNIGNVDIASALPAGSNAIGKLAANSGVDIGDVDILSIAAGSNIIGKVGHAITGIGHGVKTVTTAGTDVALASTTACRKVVIQSQTDNTSLIAVGGSGVDATIATGTGVVLYPGETFELEIDDLADVYIDSLVNGEGVRFTYFT